MKRQFLGLSIAGFIVLLDQGTKIWISHMKPALRVIPGFFNIHYVENTGAAFGILQGKQMFLTLVSVLAVGILLFLMFYEHKAGQGLLIALGLILGGTCGNLIDRIRLKFVVDFLQFYLKLFGKYYYWPSFNIADTAISIGVGLLILVTIRQEYFSKSSHTPSV